MDTIAQSFKNPAEKAMRRGVLLLLATLSLVFLGAVSAHADDLGAEQPTQPVVDTRDVHDWG
ncbi:MULTISPECIES: hypothetical protein [unclassified Streptomyces]|uniref:hypothetical protein n=1 Tax=unclassified Streptomyces TaxID=2593676 RepID=UPI002E130E08|nr:hypothetical protein OG311_39955 [Streptomyces sp. NBC_01343]